MKTLLFAAAMATALVLPVTAETAKPAIDKIERPRHEMRKDMHGKVRGERPHLKPEQKAAFEALHKECKERKKAADTPEVTAAVRKDCRAKHEALREKLGIKKDERFHKPRDLKEPGKDKVKRDEIRARYKELRAKEGAAKE